MAKNVRLCTVKNGETTEWAEQDARGFLWLKGKDAGTEWGSPAAVQDVAEFFAENGRDFDASRLPLTPIADPYLNWK